MPKRPHTKTVAGLRVPYASHPEVRALKRRGHQPSIHGTKLWGSSQILIDFLAATTLNPPASVIDAGCGWGLPGIWCAHHFGATVASVDADAAVMPYLELTARLNSTRVTPVVAKFEDLTPELLSRADLLMAADICFWDELVTPVLSMIRLAIESGTQRIVISDPQRAPFIRVAESVIDSYGGELIEWRADGTRTVGSVLVIENA